MKMLKLIFIVTIIFLGLFVTAVYLFSDKKSMPFPSAQDTVSYKNISSQKLAAMLLKKDFFFANVHIPYAGEIEKTDVFIPYNEIEKNFYKLPKDKNAKIVLYCRSGRMSQEASKKLVSLGYTNVYNLVGGMIEWKKQGHPLIWTLR